MVLFIIGAFKLFEVLSRCFNSNNKGYLFKHVVFYIGYVEQIALKWTLEGLCQQKCSNV